MNDLFLIAGIAGQRIALAAGHVDSVVNVRQSVAVPMAPRHILGLAALRSRVITMIDTRAAIGLPPAESADALTTVVVNLDGHQYGLVVDHVEDVCAVAGGIAPVRTRLGHDWAAVSAGMLDHGGSSLLVIDPALLVVGQSRLAA